MYIFSFASALFLAVIASVSETKKQTRVSGLTEKRAIDLMLRLFSLPDSLFDTKLLFRGRGEGKRQRGNGRPQ